MSDEVFQYKTFQSKSEGLYKEKGSKFIAIGFPIIDETDFKQQREIIKKGHHAARHHCYAYLMGSNGEINRANDDGEPSGTAGKPILGQLIKAGLSYSAIVVVRYYGGTKLGVGGLIKAYKGAAADCVNQAHITTYYKKCEYRLLFGYEFTKLVERRLKNFDHQILSQKFESSCELRIEINRNDQIEFEKAFEQDHAIDLFLVP